MNRMIRNAALGVLTMCALVACGRKETAGADVRRVKTAVAKGINDGAEVAYSGKTKSATDANVSFRVSGTIERVLVKKGDHVRRGQTLAVLDSRDYQTQLSAAEAEYKQIKADADRVEAMFKEQATTASNYDRARYGLQQITEKLNNCRHQLADCRLVAPMDGVVQDIVHEAGETVGAGMPVVSMFQSSDVEVEVYIPAAEYARMDSLTQATCTFDVLPGRELPLTVSRLSGEANASQLYEVRMRIGDAEGRKRITPGMSTMVTLRFQMSNADKGVMIPTSAVMADKGECYVYVYNPDQHIVQRRPVSVGAIDNRGCVSVQQGLKRGEVVVSAGVRFLEDGMKVEPLAEPSASNVGGLL